MSFVRNAFFKKDKGPLPDGPPKRISTPAGQRLSVILENAPDMPSSRPRRRSFSKIINPMESPRKSSDRSNPFSIPSVWSEVSPTTSEKQGSTGSTVSIKQYFVTKRGGWKRLAIIVAVVIGIIVAIVVGVVVGLRQKNQQSVSLEPSTSTTSDSDSAASPAEDDEDTSTDSTDSTPSEISSAPDFPAGSYSIVTFLDTVQTNCTSNPATWSCFPYTDYNTSPIESLTVFNWKIEQSSSNSDEYFISSSNNPLAITFPKSPLELRDEGQESEHYRFGLTFDKDVVPSEPLTSDNSASTCVFGGTTLQAYLYTRRERSYPDPEYDVGSDAAFPQWPYAARIEQVASGGPDIPSCFRLNGGETGERITEGLEAVEQGAASLCSCLYKNWRTPDVYRVR